MVMLGLTFGTGLPLAYGITAVALLFQGAVDRRALMGCKVSSRYDADLPRLMIGECGSNSLKLSIGLQSIDVS